MDGIAEASAWITATLLAASPVTALVGQGVYLDLAPSEAVLPYIVYSPAAAQDTNTNGGNRILVRTRWLIKAVTDDHSGASVAAVSIMAAVDAALHGAQGAVSGAYIAGCIREQSFAYTEADPGGAKFRHRGGRYRIDVARG